MIISSDSEIEKIKAILSEIPDPEIPVLNIMEIGMVREVFVNRESKIEISITPTYSGCPAIDPIKKDIEQALKKANVEKYVLRQNLSPPWTTEWMTNEAKKKLNQYGIAPPKSFSQLDENQPFSNIACPKCGSKSTDLINAFGSTPCKALLKCRECLEPFEYFKCF